MTLATRIAVMNHGRIAQVGEPREIYESPKSRFVADFVGKVNLMDGRLAAADATGTGRIVECPGCRCFVERGADGAAGSQVAVALRPEKIELERERPDREAGWQPSFEAGAAQGCDFNRVQGQIHDIAYFGSFTVFHLELEGGAILKVSRPNMRRSGDESFAAGDRVWAHWTADAAVVLEH